MRRRKQSADEPALRLEWRSPEELADNPANWRRHPTSQMRAVSDLVGEVGWAGAVLFNEKTGRLLDGHLRKGIAQKRGEKVPVLVGSWSPAQEAKILATLDPVGAMADADGDALRALAGSIKTDSEVLQQLLGQMAAPDRDTEIERMTVKAPPKLAWVLVGIPLDRYGDVYDLVTQLQQVAGVSVQTSRH